MVLFADKTVVLAVSSANIYSGSIDISEPLDTYDDAYTLSENLCQYLNKCCKSRIVAFKPQIDASVMGFNPIYNYALYNIDGGITPLTLVHNNA